MIVGELVWLIHNVVAHPLLGAASTLHRVAVWLHDATAPTLAREMVDMELVS